jgi:replicative DNA helicase
MVGSNLLRLISYPAFSASLTDVEDDLEKLEIQEGFIPDIIIVDYADILAPEGKHREYRHQIDEIWKRLKGMAEERSCLVVTGSQSNRMSMDKEILEEKDTAEDARKLAHTDVMLTLNQTSKEKEQGVWRVGILEHRWKKFNKRQQLMALQKFEIGQPILDGEIIYYEYQREK